jgi:hypothetical protein
MRLKSQKRNALKFVSQTIPPQAEALTYAAVPEAGGELAGNLSNQPQLFQQWLRIKDV